MPFRVTEKVAHDLEKAADATGAKVPELLREAADAIVRAHKRSRDGRVPKDMEIRPRYYPEVEAVNWDVAEAPPGETISGVMAQSPRLAAAYFAGRLRGEISTHPHFVHARSRGAFLECLRAALWGELAAMARDVGGPTAITPTTEDLLPDAAAKAFPVGQPPPTEPGAANRSAHK